MESLEKHINEICSNEICIRRGCPVWSCSLGLNFGVGNSRVEMSYKPKIQMSKAFYGHTKKSEKRLWNGILIQGFE